MKRPADAIRCTALVYNGKVDMDYTSNVLVTLWNGENFSYTEKGRFKDVVHSVVETRIEDTIHLTIDVCHGGIVG